MYIQNSDAANIRDPYIGAEHRQIRSLDCGFVMSLLSLKTAGIVGCL
jgi:hypothetical protein